MPRLIKMQTSSIKEILKVYQQNVDYLYNPQCVNIIINFRIDIEVQRVITTYLTDTLYKVLHLHIPNREWLQ